MYPVRNNSKLWKHMLPLWYMYPVRNNGKSWKHMLPLWYMYPVWNNSTSWKHMLPLWYMYPVRNNSKSWKHSHVYSFSQLYEICTHTTVRDKFRWLLGPACSKSKCNYRCMFLFRPYLYASLMVKKSWSIWSLFALFVCHPLLASFELHISDFGWSTWWFSPSICDTHI